MFNLPTSTTIGLISPAAPSPVDMLEQGEALLRRHGFAVKRMPHAAASHHHYLGGTDAQRLEDLHAAYADPEIDAILACRGGYGCTRLLPHVDFELIRQNPKPLLGFSDLTALLNAIYRETGQQGYYSPMLTSNLAQSGQDWTWAQWLAMLRHDRQTPFPIANQDPYTCFVPGVAEGPLLGGNLTLLAALCGTPWQPNTQGAVVFIEDWKESFYSLDRQFEQLKQAGLLTGIAGLLLCDFSECPQGDAPFTLTEHLRWLTEALGVPVGYGFTVGHGDQTATLPFGARARFDSVSGQLTIH
jgi:muramoyltetrapeptide carboxypeptidase